MVDSSATDALLWKWLRDTSVLYKHFPKVFARVCSIRKLQRKANHGDWLKERGVCGFGTHDENLLFNVALKKKKKMI